MEEMPEKFHLAQNYPNPFNPTTTIEYSIPVDSRQYAVGSQQNQSFNQSVRRSSTKSNVDGTISHSLVKLKVYDVLGREVATLVKEQQKPGSYSLKFDAGHFSSGVYFYTLQAGKFVQTRKMVLIK
jgi:hypothetical protein